MKVVNVLQMKCFKNCSWLPAFLFVCLLAGCGHRKMVYEGGTYQGETEDGLPSGYGVWKCNGRADSVYTGFWLKGKRWGTGTLRSGRYAYTGEFANGKFDGYGELVCGDSVMYSGLWRQGVRQGRGTVTDSRGGKIVGYWDNGTLVGGTRTDSLGTYSGDLTADGTPQGHGSYRGADGAYYEGHWTNGERDIFGFSISPDRRMRVGEWRADRYLGERVVYTNDRIYGIDISKYQHIIGRKRYGISWADLRITHLGTISRKIINGRVDFPISFVYIKSTEGASLLNPYYAADYIQARRHGFRVGSYHFFSHRTPAGVQARFFLRYSKFRPGDFPPVLDVEPTHKQVAAMGGVGPMFRRIQTWLDIVERATGRRPILYVGQSFVNRYLPSAPYIKNNYHIWIARYGEYKPDVKLIYWQLCPDGHVRGIRGKVDINVFNGYKNEFDEFCRQYTFQ